MSLREVRFTYDPTEHEDLDLEFIEDQMIEACAALLGCVCKPGMDDDDCKAGQWMASSGPVPDA